MILEAIYKLLSENEDVTALVGDQIHYEHRPAKETGASIVLEGEDENDFHTFDGPAGYVQGMVRINLFADTPLDLPPIRKAIRAVVNGFIGNVEVGDPAESLFIHYLKCDGGGRIPIVNLDGKESPPFYGRFIDVRFQIAE